MKSTFVSAWHVVTGGYFRIIDYIMEAQDPKQQKIITQ